MNTAKKSINTDFEIIRAIENRNKNYAKMDYVFQNKIGPYYLQSSIRFGKYRGKNIKHIAENNFSYILWCMKEIEKFYIYDDVSDFIKNIAPEVDIPEHKIIIKNMDSKVNIPHNKIIGYF